MIYLSSSVPVHLPNALSSSIPVHLPSVITSQSDSGFLHSFVFLSESPLAQNAYALYVVVVVAAAAVPRGRLATSARHRQWLAYSLGQP